MVSATFVGCFKILREGLRRELTQRGHLVTHYFESMDGQPLALNFQNSADDTITVFWGPKNNRHKLVDPDSKMLADAIEKSLDEKVQPPPAIKRSSPQQAAAPKQKPQQAAASKQKPQGGVFVTDADYAELQRLRSMANHGVWIGNAVYAAMKEEMRIGYVPMEARQKINTSFDRLWRMMA